MKSLNGGIERGFAGREGKEDDGGDEHEDEENVDAPFGAGGSSAEEWLADGMGGEEMELDEGSAVGYAVEKRLRPVPRGVEADGPPERTGAPEAEAEEESDKAGAEQADGGLAGIGSVAEAEEERE